MNAANQHGKTPAPPKSREITPDMLPKLYDVGEKSMALNRLDEAAWCFERAAVFDPASARPLKGLAQTRQLQGRPAEAHHLIDQAVTLAPTAENFTIMGQICQSQGDFAAAITAFRAAVGIDPTYGPAHLRLALLRGAADPAAHIAELERLSALTSLDADRIATLNFALAKSCENAGDHERAFAVYRRANGVRRRQHPGYSDSFTSADRMVSVFTPAFVRSMAPLGDSAAQPVFVVG